MQRKQLQEITNILFMLKIQLHAAQVRPYMVNLQEIMVCVLKQLVVMLYALRLHRTQLEVVLQRVMLPDQLQIVIMDHTRLLLAAMGYLVVQELVTELAGVQKIVMEYRGQLRGVMGYVV